MGRCMLVYNGYKFTKRDHSIVTKTHTKTRWRCSFKRNGRYTCKARAQTQLSVDGIETVKYLGVHNHSPVFN